MTDISKSSPQATPTTFEEAYRQIEAQALGMSAQGCRLPTKDEFAQIVWERLADARAERDRALNAAGTVATALEDLESGACYSKYGPGCDGSCKGVATRALDALRTALAADQPTKGGEADGAER